MAGDDSRMAGGESRMTGDYCRPEGSIHRCVRTHSHLYSYICLVALLDNTQSSFSSITISTVDVTIWKLGRTVCVYSMVQRREQEKDSRYIQEASAPAAAPCIRPVTPCTSVTVEYPMASGV